MEIVDQRMHFFHSTTVIHYRCGACEKTWDSDPAYPVRYDNKRKCPHCGIELALFTPMMNGRGTGGPAIIELADEDFDGFASVMQPKS
jgi:hypothetical protein